MRRAVAVIVMGLSLLAAVAKADVTMVWQMTDEGEKPTEMTTCWTPGAMATVMPEMRSVIRFDKKLMWIISPAEKSYQEMTFEQMKAMMGKAQEMMAKMEEQMKSMPAEQQEMMKKMMAGKMAGKTEMKVEDGDANKKVAGFSAHLWHIKHISGKDVQVSDLWATKDIVFPADMLKDLESMKDVFGKMPKGPVSDQADMYSTEMLKIGGVPVQMQHKSPNGKVQTQTMTKFSTDGVDKGTFEVPAGFEKKVMAMPGMGAPGGEPKEEPAE